MIADDYIKGRLVDFGWRSAGHVSVNAALAVMLGVRNRVNASEQEWQAKDWVRVIEEQEVTSRKRTDVRHPDFLKLLELVDSIYDGTMLDKLTDGALYWTDDEHLTTFDKKGKERTAVHGTLTFWK